MKRIKRVKVSVHQRTSRVPFRSGDYEATLYEVDADGIETDLVSLFTTRNHETWASAVRAALKKADRAAWKVFHRGLIEKKLAAQENR